MTFVWSPEKTRLFRFESDFVVNASAGTGKTATLVELYFRLLSGQSAYPMAVKPANILAITFTEKAARQMRERVEARLRDVRTELDAGQTVGNTLGDAVIATFHAFCAWLLRSYPFEAGLSPDFDIAEELQSHQILDRAVTEIMLEQLQSADKASDTERLFTLYDPKELAAILKNLVLRSETGEHPVPVYGTELRKLEPYLQKAYEDYSDGILALKNKLASMAKPTSRTIELVSQCAKQWESLVTSQSLPGPKTGTDEGMDFFLQWAKFQAGRAQEEVREPFLSLKQTREQALSLWAQMKVLPDIIALQQIVQAVRARFEALKLAMNVVDFAGLQIRAKHLLQERPEIRRAIQSQFHVILVDESQDTNGPQLELLENLVYRDPESAKKLQLPPARFLYVGDRKQSIYRFRGADVTAFRRLQDVVQKRGGEVLHFSGNFRSKPSLLRFFNAFFREALEGGRQSYDVRYSDGDDLHPGREDEEEDREIRVELFCQDKEKSGSNAERRVREARALVARLRALRQDGSQTIFSGREGDRFAWGDVAVLLRRMTYATTYEQAFREAGIPYTISQSKGFLQRLEVTDLLHLLRFTLQPLNPVSRVAVLRSPAVLVSDASLLFLLKQADKHWLPEHFSLANWTEILRSSEMDGPERERFLHFVSVCEALRMRLPLLPVSEVLEELAKSLDLSLVAGLSHEASRRRANQQKLIELAFGFEQDSPGSSPQAFLKHIDEMLRLKEEEAEGNDPAPEGVRIMTIHKAKGLEFPIVVVPDLDQVVQAPTQPVFVGQDGVPRMKLTVPSIMESYDTSGYLEARNDQKMEELAEHRRLLYVALTRARDYLILSGDVGKKSPDVESRWMDWITDFSAGHQEMVQVFSIEKTLDGRSGDEVASGAEALKGFQSVEEAIEAMQYFEPLDIAPHVMGTFSITQISELFHCERRFLLKRLLDRSTLLWMEQDSDEPLMVENAYGLEAGLLVHRFFESLKEEVFSAEHWERFLDAQGLDKNAEWAKTLGRRVLETGAFPEGSAAGSIKREIPFLSELALPSGRSIRLKGRMDALKLLEEGGFCLVDYKTSHYSPERFAFHQIQLQLYACVLRAALGGNLGVSRAYIAYLLDDQAWRELVITDASLDAFLAGLDAALQQTLKQEHFGLENWTMLSEADCLDHECAYKTLCGRGAKKLEVKASLS